MKKIISQKKKKIPTISFWTYIYCTLVNDATPGWSHSGDCLNHNLMGGYLHKNHSYKSLYNASNVSRVHHTHHHCPSLNSVKHYRKQIIALGKRALGQSFIL